MIIALRIVEIGVAVMLIAGLLTQVIVPSILGTRTFPMFRRKSRLSKLEADMAETRSELEEERLLEAIEQAQDDVRLKELKAELARLRRRREQDRVRAKTEQERGRR
jgi:hypothetical protein